LWRYSRCTTGVIDTCGKWKKSAIINVLIILFGHLWEVELTYRYIFAFKFTLGSQQPDNVPIVPGVIDTGGKFAAGVIDIGGKLPLVLLTLVVNNTSETGGKICRQCP
jgi:hypothetical protein